MRAGGSGIPAFFTASGVGTQVADGGLPWRYATDGSVRIASPAKEVRAFLTARGKREFVLERAIVADYSLVRAWKGDRHGNLDRVGRPAAGWPVAQALGTRFMYSQVWSGARPAKYLPQPSSTCGAEVMCWVPA